MALKAVLKNSEAFRCWKSFIASSLQNKGLDWYFFFLGLRFKVVSNVSYHFVSYCFVSSVSAITEMRSARCKVISFEMKCCTREREGLPPFPTLSRRINIFGFHSFQFAVISFLALAMIIRIQWTIQEFVLLIKEEKQAQWQDSWRRRDMNRERTNLFNHLNGMIGEENTIC